MKIYDIAFVGMGASALGTYKLKYHNQDASIIGIDRDFNNSRNNFFAFWMTDWMAPFKDIVKNKWNKWEFYNQHQKLTHEGIGSPYCVIRYQDWKKFCLEEGHNISIKENHASKIEKRDNFFEITLDNEEKVYCKKIYDSRSVNIENNGLKQHFIGNIITVNGGHQIKNVRLMDFRVKQDQGLHFIYLLPLDSNRLLVESTVFSKFLLDPSWYQNQISNYIDKNLDIKKYEVTDSEQGVLPMFEINSQNKENYVHIGTKGGATKISSGYAFSFFLKQLTSKDKDYHSYWDQWMDKIFVNYLENNDKSDEIFMKMAEKLNGEEFGSFMMGHANFITKLKIIFAMPKIGFIKSYLRTVLN